MSQSEGINELAAALSKAQGEMQAAIKDKVNPFYRQNYADLGSVWDAARPVLSKYGLCVIQTMEMIQDKIFMVTTLAHTSGQWIKSHLPLNPSKNDNQGIGAAITYLRRYSLSAIVGVVCDDDDDGETAVGRGKTTQNNVSNQHKVQESAEPQVINQKQVQNIKKLLESVDEEFKNNLSKVFKKKFNSSDVEKVYANAYENVVKHIEDYITEKQKQELKVNVG